MLSRRSSKFKSAVQPAGIAYVGTDQADSDLSAGVKNSTIFVPSDATFALIGFAYFTWTIAREIISASIDGVPATLIDHSPNDTGDSNTAQVFHCSGFGSGNVTLSWEQPEFHQNSAVSTIVTFYKGVNLITPYRDYAFANIGSPNTLVTTPNITVQPGDLLFGYCASDYATSPTRPDMTMNNQNQRNLHVPANVQVSCAADKELDGNNYMQAQAEYGAVFGVSLIPE